MISTIDELRIPVIKGQENLDALLMQQLLSSFDELVTVDENGFTSIDSINLPDINYLDELKVVNQKHIRTMITEVAQQTYESFQDAYKYRSKTFIKFDEFDDLQFDLDLIVASVLALYNELLSRPVINMNVSATSKVMSAIKPKQALRVLVNEAQQQINFHTKDLYKAIRKTTRSIIDSSVRVVVIENEKRSVKRMTSAVDSLMLDAVNQVKDTVFKHVDKDIQFDGIELSVHFNSALDHAPVQGHQFSNEEFNKLQNNTAFKDYQGHTFVPIERPIGMWNCRHIAYPIILGVTKQQFTQEELDAINNENDKEVKILDRQMSKRDAVNLANHYLEKAKRMKEASVEAGYALGDTQLSQEYIKKYLKYNKMYKLINKALRAM